MNDKFYYIATSVYTLIYMLNMSYYLYSYLSFKKIIKKYKATSMMDNLYAIAIYMVGFLYTGMYTSSAVEIFQNIGKYENDDLPFIIYAMPIMIITFNILVNEGIYAYSCDKLFIGGKKIITKENVKISKIKKNSITGRAKIVITINNASSENNRRFIIRTSISKIQPFIEIFDS